MPTILEAARAWYARGFTPMAAAKKRPLAKGWQKLDAETHLAIIENPALLRELDPKLEHDTHTVPQLGLRMGTQRDGRCLICIDVDDPLGLDKAESELGELPPTLTQRTGSGGQHLVYVWPGELEAPTTNASKIAKGVDVRCERGHIVAAPSIHHEHGKPYEVTNDVEPAPLPRRWAEALEPKDEPIVSLPVPPVANPSQQLQDCLNYTARMAPSIAGSGGSTACMTVALKCVQFALSQQDAMHVMLVYNQRCQPPWSKRELEHKIKSAYTKGKVKPGTKGSMAREPLPERSPDARRVERREKPEVLARANPQVQAEQANPAAGGGRTPQSDAGAARPADTKRAEKGAADRAVASNPKEPKREAPKLDDGLDPEWCSPDIETWWLPKPIQDWVVATSECRQVPALMPTMAALCTLAAICQGRCEVKYCAAPAEPLSLYWFLFAGTGTRKSTVMNAATKPLRDYLRKLHEECEPERKAAQRRKAQLENDEKRLLRQKCSDWSPEGQARKNELAAIGHELDTMKIPAVPMMLVSDINPHMLPAVLKQNHEADGIAAAAALDAEGTIVANMLGRHTGHVHVDTLLKASMGEPLELVRASKNSDNLFTAVLPHSHLTIGVMAQPHYIDRFREHPELSDTGFMGRCVLSSLPNIRPVNGDEQEVPERITRAYAECIQRRADADLPELVDLRQSAPWALWRDTLPDLGAPGWSARVLGRVARIAALCELVNRFGVADGASSGTVREDVTVRLSEGSEGLRGRDEGIKEIECLYTYFIRKDIQGIQILERPSTLRSALARRITPRLLTVGQCLTVREVQRWLTCSRAQAIEACDELVAAGTLEQAGETRRGNRTVTITYRVVVLPPKAEQAKRRAPRWAIDDAGPDPENDGR